MSNNNNSSSASLHIDKTFTSVHLTGGKACVANASRPDLTVAGGIRVYKASCFGGSTNFNDDVSVFGNLDVVGNAILSVIHVPTLVDCLAINGNVCITGGLTVNGNTVGGGSNTTVLDDLAAPTRYPTAPQTDGVWYGTNARAGCTGGQGAICIGNGPVASQFNSIAIGASSNTATVNGIGIGTSTAIDFASDDGIAIGNGASIIASTQGIAIGKNASINTTNRDCIAIGKNTSVTGFGGTAVGAQSVASAQNTVAIGRNATASVDGSSAVGVSAQADGTESCAFGGSSHAGGLGIDFAVAVGFDAMATESSTTALGFQSKALSAQSVAVGAGATASGSNSVSVGYQAGNFLAIAQTENTLIGATAGSSLVSGSNVTCVGFNAQPSTASISNEMTLGDTNLQTLRTHGHIVGFGITANPSSTPGSGAGASPVFTLIGCDIAFVYTVAPGVGPVPDGVVTTITFATPFTSSQVVVTFSPNNVDTAGVSGVTYIDNVTATGFDLRSTIANPNTYSWNFHVIGY